MFTLTLWRIKGREEGKDCDVEMTDENNSGQSKYNDRFHTMEILDALSFYFQSNDHLIYKIM